MLLTDAEKYKFVGVNEIELIEDCGVSTLLLLLSEDLLLKVKHLGDKGRSDVFVVLRVITIDY